MFPKLYDEVPANSQGPFYGPLAQFPNLLDDGDHVMMNDTPCPACGFRGPHRPVQDSTIVLCGRCIGQQVWEQPDALGDGVTTPDLRLLHPGLHVLARAALTKQEALGFLALAKSHQRLAFFGNNLGLLHTLGLYEAALLEAFSSTKGN